MKKLKIYIEKTPLRLKFLVRLSIWLIILINLSIGLYVALSEPQQSLLILVFSHVLTVFFTLFFTVIVLLLSAILYILGVVPEKLNFNKDFSQFKHYWISFIGTGMALIIHFLKL